MRRTTRRGVAMLVVLSAVVILVPLAATLARAAALARQEALVAGATRSADDLLAACEPAIRAWLEEHAASVVLPPGTDQPRVLVLDDTWVAGGSRWTVRIAAWDQRGMVSFAAARSSRSLRQAVRADVLSLLGRAVQLGNARPGLDQLESPDRCDGTGAGAVYPGGTGDAAGAFISMHETARGGVNVNTAPRPLLVAALREAGRGGLNEVLRARRDGRMTSVGTLPADGAGGDEGPRLVSSSDAWGVRIDIEVASVRRSWWAVYAQVNSRTWERTQRVAIRE